MSEKINHEQKEGQKKANLSNENAQPTDASNNKKNFTGLSDALRNNLKRRKQADWKAK